MDYVRNVFSLPDEVLVALNHILDHNTTATCEEKSPAKRYPIRDDDIDDPVTRSIDTLSSMQRKTNSFEREDCRYSTNGPADRQNYPPGAQRKPSASCSQNQGFSGCDSSKCSIDSQCYQEELPVYPSQDQTLHQQLKRPCQLQVPQSRPQQCQRRFSRSQSVPRGNFNEIYIATQRFDCPRGLPAGQETKNPPRSCCAPRSSCEGDVPTRNTSNYVPARNSRGNDCDNWNNSSQVGTDYGEWQRRQMMMQPPPHQQQQRQRQQFPACQQQFNESKMSYFGDDEISAFKPGINSTMIDEEKRQKSTKNYSQPPMSRQCSSCNKSCGQQSYETPQMPRRVAQCDASQMQRRHTPSESLPMQRRKFPQYETFMNQTSYLDLPEAIKHAPCRTSADRNQCPNSQTMYQDIPPINFRKQCQTSPRSRSLSPGNGSKYQSANTSEMEMEDTGMCPEDTNRTRSSRYMDMSRAMMARSCLNKTNQERTNQNNGCGGRSKRIHPKTPEEYLAERIQDEFMEALVKDRSCPGAIQTCLNGNENFNEFSFDIAFAGPVPTKPLPVDPITMLEAFKLRIDYEREEIRKIQRPVTTEVIESHFRDKIKTEVNDGVAAFLQAEIEYQTNMNPDSFEAEINSVETHMLDESIKVNAYSATTQPGQEGVLELRNRSVT